MKRLFAPIAACLFFLTISPITADAQAAGTWSTGKKTYTPSNTTPGSRMDLDGGPDQWTFSAISIINSPAGNEVADLTFYFGTVGMPPAGRYKIVDGSAPASRNTVSVTASISEATGDPYSYSCTGAGEHYVVVSVKDGHAAIKMDAAPALDNTMEKSTMLSADLVQTDEASE